MSASGAVLGSSTPADNANDMTGTARVSVSEAYLSYADRVLAGKETDVEEVHFPIHVRGLTGIPYL
jgi:hypothetical protein